MNSRKEILHLINSYCFLLDEGDLEGWAALFENGEWGPEGTTPVSGKEQMLDMINDILIVYPDGTPRTRHVMSNVDLDIDEQNNTASCESYVTLFQQTDDFPLQVILSGGFSDKFARVDGKWRFAKRVTKRPFFGDMSAHVKSVPPTGD